MRFLPAGRFGVLIELPDLDSVISLDAELRRDLPAGVIDMVPAARSVLLVHDDSTSMSRIATQVGARSVERVGSPDAKPVDIPVTYDGPDLAEVANQTGLSEDDVARRHAAREYVVAFIGFAPGFAYLVGGDRALGVARRETPRTKVPGGAVALAGEFTGIYPREGPGGWQLIGRTDSVLWDLARDPPVLLPPGTRVRFVDATR